jgi:hypothetical protein
MKNILIILLLLITCYYCFPEVYALKENKYTRQIEVIRKYYLQIIKDSQNAIEIPAMLNSLGSTNWQVIKSSEFSYSEKPDKIEIVVDNEKSLMRYYKITWSNPKSEKIEITQKINVELSFFCTLYTKATIPYSKDILKKYSDFLITNEKINLNDKQTIKIYNGIVGKSEKAEEMVEMVLDCIETNISVNFNSYETISTLACSVLRKLGIPTNIVSAKKIGNENKTYFIEVYFPDTGWVFYRPFSSRGYIINNFLILFGDFYKLNDKWYTGYNSNESEINSYPLAQIDKSKILRKQPIGIFYDGALVKEESPPSTIKCRFESINEIVNNMDIKPGVREFK